VRFWGRRDGGAWYAAAAGLWLLLEWLRGWLFTGFPWLQLGYSQTDTWLAGWGPLCGSYGIGALLLGMVALLGWGWQGGPRRRALALAGVALPWLVGRLLLPVAWSTATGQPVSVAVLQGAVPQSIKWLTTNRDPTRELYRRLNGEALGARLIVWPEAAVTELANQIPRYLGEVMRESQERGSDVVMGILRMDDRSEDVYNSMLALSAPIQFYDKRHLVPYSEFFPVPDWVRGILQRLDLPYSDITHGREGQPPLAAAGLKLGATICYEDAFGDAQRAVLTEADALVNVTNDAWFGHSPARYQHFQMTRMRALEARRWLIRAANDGLSAIIGPDGRVVQSATEFQPAVLRGTVTPLGGLTPYARWGDGPVLAAVALLLAASLVAARRRS
jgi:apolipoprotein N-acyltransferase